MKIGSGTRVAQRLALMLSVAATVLAAACSTTTTPADRQIATQRLNYVWGAENQLTRGELKNRTVDGTPAQVHRAARQTMIRIGLVIDETQSQPPNVVGGNVFANGGWSWNEAVQLSEEPRMRSVFVQAIGPAGANLTLTPTDEVMTASVVVGSTSANATEVSVDFATASPGVDCRVTACTAQIPPMALRSAYYAFWQAFDEELGDVVEEDRAEAAAHRQRSQRARPRPARPTRPPSDWTPPPSGWTPPPRRGN